ncbi:MAG: hypothetical protein WBB19_10900 [Desulforhopalus sp.]
MHRLSVDFKKCKDCENCEKLLPGFRTVYGGILMISNQSHDDVEIRAAVDKVKDGCPEGAILFEVLC